MSMQICPYHERLQKEVNGLTEIITELREWRAAEEVKQINLEQKFNERLSEAIAWIKWSVGISITTIVTLLAVILGEFIR